MVAVGSAPTGGDRYDNEGSLLIGTEVSGKFQTESLCTTSRCQKSCPSGPSSTSCSSWTSFLLALLLGVLLLGVFLESFFLESFFAFFEERPSSSSSSRCRFSGRRPGVARGPTRHPPEPQPAAYPRGTRFPPSHSRVPADRGPLPPSGRRRGVVLLVAVVEDGFEKFHRSLRNDSEAVQKALSFLPDAGLASGAGTGPGTVAGGGESRVDRGGAETGREPHAPVLYRRRSPPGTTRVDGSAATGV